MHELSEQDGSMLQVLLHVGKHVRWATVKKNTSDKSARIHVAVEVAAALLLLLLLPLIFAVAASDP